jgi:hypothetical protein
VSGFPSKGGRILSAFSGRGAAPARVAALLLVGLFSWVSIVSLREESDPPVSRSSRAVLEERWAAQWNAFVSGNEPRGEITIDPFAAEIPNPESIDF